VVDADGQKLASCLVPRYFSASLKFIFPLLFAGATGWTRRATVREWTNLASSIA